MSIDEEVLRFKVSVDDSARVAIVDSIAKLIKEEFDLIGGHCVFVFAQIFFHVIFHEFKYQV